MSNERMAHTRALLVGPFPPPVGGDTVLTANLAESGCWRRHGIEIERIDTSPGDRVRLPGERISARDAVRGARILVEFISKLRRCRLVLLWANSRFALTAGLLLIIWCRLCRRPVFVKPFGAFLARRIARLPEPRRSLSIRLLAMSECILAETRGLASALVDETRLPRGRVLLLPNFLPAGAFAAELEPRAFSGRCVFFGQIKREKGVFDIIEAVGEKEGVRCDFYGPLLERDRKEFLDAISRRANLAYRGVAAPGTVSGLARSYDVLLLPTFHEGEGYPAVILEAYAAGVPVIATRWLSVPEIVGDGETGFLVPPRSPERIAEALDALRSDPARYESMRRGAFERARGFSESAIVGDILVPRVLAALSRDGASRASDRMERGVR